MDATLTSLEGKAAEVQADAQDKASKVLAELRKNRDGFRDAIKMQAGANEAAWTKCQDKAGSRRPIGTALRPRSNGPNRTHRKPSRSIPRCLSSLDAACERTLPPGRFRSARPTCSSLIDVIEVDDTQICIKGSKDVLERAVLASRNGVTPDSQINTGWRSLGKCTNPTISKCHQEVWAKLASLIFKVFQRDNPNPFYRRPSQTPPMRAQMK
jgi:hypothetical protein